MRRFIMEEPAQAGETVELNPYTGLLRPVRFTVHYFGQDYSRCGKWEKGDQWNDDPKQVTCQVCRSLYLIPEQGAGDNRAVQQGHESVQA